VRILLDYRPALRQRTGVGEYVHETARALAATAPPDEELVLFSASWKDRLDPDVVPGAIVVDRRIPVRILNRLWHRLSWPAVEQVAGRPFDIAHAAHPLLIPARSAARVVTVHDLDFLDHPERTRAEVRRDYPALAAAHARAADQVIVVSRFTAREVERRLGVPRARIAICSPGAPDWAPRPAEPPAAQGYLLFLGTLEPRKNVALLVEAYERLIARRPDAPRLILAGGMTPEAAPLVERIGRPPLAGRIELAGYIDPERRRDLFAGAIAFVLPSHLEGFGMTAVEAMTAGVPVIAADRGALPEVVGRAGRLIDPADALDLMQAMDEVVTDAGRRREMIARGFEEARRYSWRTTADRLREAWGRASARRRERHG
jgi:glycosyltransferase involved in cell wall biosynthesis